MTEHRDESDVARPVVPSKPCSDRYDRIESAAIYVAGALDGMAAVPGGDISTTALIGLAVVLRNAVTDE